MNSENQISGSIFKTLASIFKKHAVIAYKIQRSTFDIDFMVTNDDYKKIESDMFELGYSIFNKTDAFVQLRGNKTGLRDIDFLLGNGPTVQGLLSNGRNVTIAGESFIASFPLIFPEISEKMAPPSIRTIDEIDSWIEHDYALFYDQEKFLEEKKKMSVYERFVLR